MKTKLKHTVFASLLFGLSGFNSANAITADELLLAVQQFAGEVSQAFTSITQSLDDQDTRIVDNDLRVTNAEAVNSDQDARITAVESDNILQDNRINEINNIVKVMTASGWDAGLNQPVVNVDWFWLDNCLTTAYMAGPGETALVTATLGIDITAGLQGEVMVASFPNGVEPFLGQHQRYFCRNCAFRDITVMDAIPLTQGVTYQFGPAGFLQGGGANITRLACQTMVQIVKIQ